MDPTVLSFVTLAVTVVLTVIGFLMQREFLRNERELTAVRDRCAVLTSICHQLQVDAANLNGKLERTIAILERVDRKLEKSEQNR